MDVRETARAALDDLGRLDLGGVAGLSADDIERIRASALRRLRQGHLAAAGETDRVAGAQPR